MDVCFTLLLRTGFGCQNESTFEIKIIKFGCTILLHTQKGEQEAMEKGLGVQKWGGDNENTKECIIDQRDNTNL